MIGDIFKNVRLGSFDVELKIHLGLHFSCKWNHTCWWMKLRAYFKLDIEVHLRFLLRNHIKIKKAGEKDVFHIAVDGLFKDAIVGAPKDALKDLRKNAKQVTMKFECEKNIVNILDFNLLLIMFESLSTIQANKKGALCQTGGSQSCSVVQVEWWK